VRIQEPGRRGADAVGMRIQADERQGACVVKPRLALTLFSTHIRQHSPRPQHTSERGATDLPTMAPSGQDAHL
jgi:hypothetical protein